MAEREVKLTDEMRKKLSVDALGMNVSAEFKYVPKAYRESGIDKAVWPLFTLTSKDGVETAELEDHIGEMVYEPGQAPAMRFNSGTSRLRVLEIGIVRAERFWLADGTRVDYDSVKGSIAINGSASVGKGARDFIRYMTPAQQTEIANAINERKELTEEELTGLE